MTDDEFESLIVYLEEALRLAGAEEVADERAYLRDPESGEDRPDDPKDRLIAMLKAFDRHLSVRDAATYRLALEQISRRVPNEIQAAVVLDARTERPAVSLADAPELGAVRRDLRWLIGQLAETPREAPPEDLQP